MDWEQIEIKWAEMARRVSGNACAGVKAVAKPVEPVPPAGRAKAADRVTSRVDAE